MRVIVILYYNPTHRQMNEHKIMGDETCGQTRQGMSVAHYSKDMDKDTDSSNYFLIRPSVKQLLVCQLTLKFYATPRTMQRQLIFMSRRVLYSCGFPFANFIRITTSVCVKHLQVLLKKLHLFKSKWHLIHNSVK